MVNEHVEVGDVDNVPVSQATASGSCGSVSDECRCGDVYLVHGCGFRGCKRKRAMPEDGPGTGLQKKVRSQQCLEVVPSDLLCALCMPVLPWGMAGSLFVYGCLRGMCSYS